MIKLDQAKLETLVRVSRLHAAHPSVLSPFEVETLWAINERALEFGLDAETTEAEWCVIGQSMLALLKADRGSDQPLGCLPAHLRRSLLKDERRRGAR